VTAALLLISLCWCPLLCTLTLRKTISYRELSISWTAESRTKRIGLRIAAQNADRDAKDAKRWGGKR
jgi:hypothetical protein